MAFFRNLNHILGHPLNRGHFRGTLQRYFAWQLGSRLVPGPVAVPFINQSMLLVRPGMVGATQNIYCGLHEFEDTSFLLHLLRPDDLFIDVGANIGAYTVLASAAIGARSVCFEPNPGTFAWLSKNIHLNHIEQIVEVHNSCVGAAAGIVHLDVSGGDMGTGHHVSFSTATPDGEPSFKTIQTPMVTLDECLAGSKPLLIKIDVEGFESTVLDGATRVLSDSTLLALIVELNDDCLRYGLGRDDAHNAILSHGFTPASYEPFSRVLHPLEGRNTNGPNTIYVRDLAAARERLKNADAFLVNGQRI